MKAEPGDPVILRLPPVSVVALGIVFLADDTTVLVYTFGTYIDPVPSFSSLCLASRSYEVPEGCPQHIGSCGWHFPF